jgi:serine/threonine-protein kinase
VYKAEQDLTGGITRPVAVKLIRPEYSESEDFREMFLDEARTACTLSHPNIAHIYEVGESEDGQLYMAMELVSGETLATVARTLRGNDERFSDEALFAIGILTCSALDAVHALRVEGGTVNLVHRDVSPHNLLLSTTGGLKLIDFGIAKAATNRNLTLPGVTKGKAGYFSPEQAMGKKLDGRSDLFSLGVTLYKLASGGTPFDDYKNHAERHAALVRGQWKDLDEVYPGLPQGFYEVVKRALALKPEDRFQTARAMREALERAAFDAGIRVGQSSLMGYLDEDGEVTAAGGSRMSAFPGIVAGPSIQTNAIVQPRQAAPNAESVRQLEPARNKFRTERLPPVPGSAAPESKRWMLAAAFLAAVILGVGGTVVLLAEPTKPPPAEPPQAEPPPTPRAVARTAEPTPPPPAAAEPVVDAGEAVVSPEPPKPVSPKPPTAPPRPKPTVVATVKPPPERSEPPAPPPRAEVIPAGRGKLRIHVSGAATISVAGEDWGGPPVNRDVASGVYSVVVKLADGSTASHKTSVYPDRTTILTFDPQTREWKTRSN